MIRKGLNGMDCSVLMGANLAKEVASGAFCETTIGYREEANGKLLMKVFNDPLFHVSIVKDVPGVEVCGALKNVPHCGDRKFLQTWPSCLCSHAVLITNYGVLEQVVALGAGFTDGMGLGDNSKAAIIRIGSGTSSPSCALCTIEQA
eukprot:3042313-Rhodomonas_salina.1